MSICGQRLERKQARTRVQVSQVTGVCVVLRHCSSVHRFRISKGHCLSSFGEYFWVCCRFLVMLWIGDQGFLNSLVVFFWLLQWVSHRNHRGNICAVDFIWLLNPNRYRKLLKTSWSEAVFGMFRVRHSLTFSHHNISPLCSFYCPNALTFFLSKMVVNRWSWNVSIIVSEGIDEEESLLLR